MYDLLSYMISTNLPCELGIGAKERHHCIASAARNTNLQLLQQHINVVGFGLVLQELEHGECDLRDVGRQRWPAFESSSSVSSLDSASQQPK